MNPIHTVIPPFLKLILILPWRPRQQLPSYIFPSGFSNEIAHEFLVASVGVTYPTHLILFNLINLTVFG
jgi:hypothetical protein